MILVSAPLGLSGFLTGLDWVGVGPRVFVE